MVSLCIIIYAYSKDRRMVSAMSKVSQLNKYKSENVSEKERKEILEKAKADKAYNESLLNPFLPQMRPSFFCD